MAADITLSSAVRNNLLSLQNTADLLGRTQERLATGLKVNSALDDPTAFFTAASLNSRANDLNRLLDSVGNALQTIRAADQGINAITDLVESAQASARQALQTAGPVTSSVAAGAATATFNPQALASVIGTGSTLTADASASFQTTANLGGDAANAVATGTDIGQGTTTLTSLGIEAGDTLVITSGADGTNQAHTITFDANTVANVTGDDFTIGINQTVANLVAGINDTDFSQVSASETNGVISITAQAADDFVTVADGNNVSGAGVTAQLGFTNTGVGADATSRLVTKNTVLDDLALNNRTLTVQRGTDTAATITFGTAANQVSNQADLIAAIDAAVGVSGTASGTNQITIANETTTDYDTNVTLNANNADVFAAIGLTADSGQTTLQTIQPNNLLTQSGGLTAGQNLQVTFGSQLSTITFGTGAQQVSSLAELNTELSNITGGAASVAVSGGNLGNISLTANNSTDTITIGGTASAVTEFGLTAGEFSNLVGGVGAPVSAAEALTITVGTNSALTVTFGTGTGQVNTLAELNNALSALAGGTASVDDQTGALTVTATSGSDNIVIGETGTNVASSFGLAVQTYTSSTTNSVDRAALETQFNNIRTQIDQLARDSSFNGNNLLQSDNLTVIFNEDATSSLTINGVDFDAGGLGINAAAANAFQSDTTINTSLNELDTALQTLRSQASTFGSQLSTVEIRQDFTKNLINTLETGAGNLTLADTNEEGANTLALQTRQQLSSVALSLASQADQQVLRLF